MLYTVSEACDAHVYAWLVMCPRTVIIYIIIVYNLEVRAACACVHLPRLPDAKNSRLNCEISPYYQLRSHRGTKTIVIALDTIPSTWLNPRGGLFGGGRIYPPFAPSEVRGCPLSVTRKCNLTFLVRRARTYVASDTIVASHGSLWYNTPGWSSQ